MKNLIIALGLLMLMVMLNEFQLQCLKLARITEL